MKGRHLLEVGILGWLLLQVFWAQFAWWPDLSWQFWFIELPTYAAFGWYAIRITNFLFPSKE